MTKNYFTGVEVDEQTYAEVQRITDLLVQYKMMEPHGVQGITEQHLQMSFGSPGAISLRNR